MLPKNKPNLYKKSPNKEFLLEMLSKKNTNKMVEEWIQQQKGLPVIRSKFNGRETLSFWTGNEYQQFYYDEFPKILQLLQKKYQNKNINNLTPELFSEINKNPEFKENNKKIIKGLQGALAKEEKEQQSSGNFFKISAFFKKGDQSSNVAKKTIKGFNQGFITVISASFIGGGLWIAASENKEEQPLQKNIQDLQKQRELEIHCTMNDTCQEMEEVIIEE